MKCAIFLLALWAFETVFAEEFDDDKLWALHLKNLKYLQTLVTKFNKHNWDIIQQAYAVNAGVNQCVNEYNEYQIYFNADIQVRCKDCYNSALEHNNMAEAKNCYARQRAELAMETNHRCRNIEHCVTEILSNRPYYPPAPRQELGPSTSNQPHTG